MAGTRPPQRRAWLALGALSVVTVIWGITFSWMKEAQEAARATLGPGHATETIALYMGLRFGLAALVMALVPRARAKADAAAWKGGFVLGALLYAGFLVQMLGLEEITPAVSAFLTSLYVLFTAAITARIARARPGFALLAGALLATLGAGLIRGRPQIDLRTGELLTVVSAVVFAVHILATDKVTRASDALAATLTTFVWVTLFSVLTFGGVQLLGAGSDAQHLQELMGARAWLEPLVLGAIFATVIALSLMNLFQKQIDPLRAAIVYAVEPIWALVFGVWRGHDVLTGWLWIGGALLLAGNLVAELGPRSRPRNPPASSSAGGKP
jgi:drug/metabolite transporter (DMT)-like permease